MILGHLAGLPIEELLPMAPAVGASWLVLRRGASRRSFASPPMSFARSTGLRARKAGANSGTGPSNERISSHE